MASQKVALACNVCGSRNYTLNLPTTRQERLSVNKFCKYCGKHTMHTQTR